VVPSNSVLPVNFPDDGTPLERDDDLLQQRFL
jgi:hypothetical protein